MYCGCLYALIIVKSSKRHNIKKMRHGFFTFSFYTVYRFSGTILEYEERKDPAKPYFLPGSENKMRKNIFFKPVIAAVLAAVLMSGCGKNTENTAETAKEAATEPASSEASESGGTDAAETPAVETDAAAEIYADQPEENAGKPGTPPEKPEGGPDGAPPDGRPGGAPPSGAPGEKGGPGGMPGGPGGGASKPESYEAAESFSKDTETSGRTYSSQGKDENAILVEGGNVSISNASVSRK